jgi:hypothetical protein
VDLADHVLYIIFGVVILSSRVVIALSSRVVIVHSSMMKVLLVLLLVLVGLSTATHRNRSTFSDFLPIKNTFFRLLM